MQYQVNLSCHFDEVFKLIIHGLSLPNFNPNEEKCFCNKGKFFVKNVNVVNWLSLDFYCYNKMTFNILLMLNLILFRNLGVSRGT